MSCSHFAGVDYRKWLLDDMSRAHRDRLDQFLAIRNSGSTFEDILQNRDPPLDPLPVIDQLLEIGEPVVGQLEPAATDRIIWVAPSARVLNQPRYQISNCGLPTLERTPSRKPFSPSYESRRSLAVLDFHLKLHAEHRLLRFSFIS